MVVEGKGGSVSEVGKARLRCDYQNVNPGFMDMLLYGYCYVGLLTGRALQHGTPYR